jgi:hypothetical protein
MNTKQSGAASYKNHKRITIIYFEFCKINIILYPESYLETPADNPRDFKKR